MKRVCALAVTAIVFSGCGPSTPGVTEQAVDTAPAAAALAADSDEIGVQTKLEPRTVGDFEVKAVYTGDLGLGHFNFYVAGAELKALRAWVGDETASGALVTKANWEEDHYCAHIEMPAPIPPTAALWFEIEGSDGTAQKASMPLGGPGK